MTACPACTCADALQNPPKVSRRCSPPLLIRQCRADAERAAISDRAWCHSKFDLSALAAASVRRVSVMTAQAPCLPTIVPESNDVSTRLLSVPAAQFAQPRNVSNKRQATAPLLL